MAATPTLTLLSCEVSSVEPLWLDGSRGPVPDLVPRLEVKEASKRKRGEKNEKVMESMFLLSILIIAVLWLYLFPPPSS